MSVTHTISPFTRCVAGCVLKRYNNRKHHQDIGGQALKYSSLFFSFLLYEGPLILLTCYFDRLALSCVEHQLDITALVLYVGFLDWIV